MVSEELTEIIKEKFRHGKRRNEIKEFLLDKGFNEEEVDAAITKIQHDAVKQLPGISHIYQLIENLESKSHLTTPKMTFLLMLSCIAFLMIVALGFYFIYDPLGTQSAARDRQRQTDISILRTAINAYYNKNQQYPDSLQKLVPEFLPKVPQDPKTGSGYQYKTLDDATNYQLCVSYELQQIACMYAQPVSSDIPVIPTETPVPDFVPQSATGAGSINAL